MLQQLVKLHSFPRLNKYPTVCVCHSSLLHSSVSEHTDCFHVLALVNSDARDVARQLSLQDTDCVSLYTRQTEALLEHKVVQVLLVWGARLHPCTPSPAVYASRSCRCPLPPVTWIKPHLWGWGDTPCRLCLALPWSSVILRASSQSYWPFFTTSLGKICAFRSAAYLKNHFYCHCHNAGTWVPYTFWILTPYQRHIFQISPSSRQATFSCSVFSLLCSSFCLM